jgi:acyl-CoA synthetase (NDP forming)
LRIANLLLRDDETVNRAEHQRLAVEIALLKAATFPRLKAIESVVASGNTGATNAAPSKAAPAARPMQSAAPRTSQETRGAEPSRASSGNPSDLVERVRQKRPLVGGYLAAAQLERNGNRLTFVFDDAFQADSVSDAKDQIAQIASDLYGEKMVVETRVGSASAETPARRAEDKPSPLKDDPVLSAFRKHLGGELVKETKR